MDPTLKWSVVPESRLVWRDWGEGEQLVYHAASGDTHLVNDITATVVRQLEEHALTVSALSEAVAGKLGFDPEREFEVVIAELLSYLDGLGLVELQT